MKAKIKATGEYVNVQQRGPTFLDTNDGSLYNVEEIDLNVVDDGMSQQEMWYWNDKRIQASIAAMQTIADTLGSVDYNKELIVKHAVELADALIEELKGGQDDRPTTKGSAGTQANHSRNLRRT